MQSKKIVAGIAGAILFSIVCGGLLGLELARFAQPKTAPEPNHALGAGPSPTWLDNLLTKQIEIAGDAMPSRTSLNFVSGANLSDNPTNNSTDVVVVGASSDAGSGVSLPDGGIGSIWYESDAAPFVAALSPPSSSNQILIGGVAGAPPKWGTVGATLPDAGTGGVWYQNGSGVVTPLAAPVSTNQVIGYTGSAPLWVTNGSGASGLVIPGTVTLPPTIAGGGWSLFTLGGGAITPTDEPNGEIDFSIPSSSASGNGYVRAGSNSSTMSVETGVSFTNNLTTSNTGTQQIFAGAEMVETGTNKWLQMNVLFFVHQNTAPYYATAIYLVGSNVSGNESYGNWAPWSQLFVRLRLSGSNVLGEISIDLQQWTTIYTTAITTAFTAAPSGGNPFKVGAGLTPSLAGGTTNVKLFDFVTN